MEVPVRRFLEVIQVSNDIGLDWEGGTGDGGKGTTQVIFMRYNGWI